jgi:hypothetical protein
LGAGFATAGNLALDPHQTSPSILLLGLFIRRPGESLWAA